jgi:hypothetical protein
MMNFEISPTSTFTWYRIQGPCMDSKSNWPSPNYALRGILIEVATKGIDEVQINGKKVSVWNNIIEDKFFSKYYQGLVCTAKEWVENEKAKYRAKKKAIQE